jgi:predicted dienelactone hydrolase
VSAAPRAAGYRRSAALDPATGTEFPVLAFYPADGAERATPLGPYTGDLAADAPAAPGAYPLLAFSHGTGGSPLVYRTLAAALARAGFVVVLPEHPGNNRDDNRLANTAQLLADRPRQLRAVVDWALADAALGPHLDRGRVAAGGHSLGGYTALAVAGGRPGSGAHESPDGVSRPVPVAPDPRVRALVLLAPATPWFRWPGALADVRAPILMLTSAQDAHTPAWHAGIVLDGVPDRSAVEHRVVPGAGHFAFLSPFPAAMTSPEFPPSQDPPGFDRDAFQAALPGEVAAFLRRVL